MHFCNWAILGPKRANTVRKYRIRLTNLREEQNLFLLLDYTEEFSFIGPIVTNRENSFFMFGLDKP